jgi:hypothetical protein
MPVSKAKSAVELDPDEIREARGDSINIKNGPIMRVIVIEFLDLQLTRYLSKMTTRIDDDAINCKRIYPIRVKSRSTRGSRASKRR